MIIWWVWIGARLVLYPLKEIIYIITCNHINAPYWVGGETFCFAIPMFILHVAGLVILYDEKLIQAAASRDVP